MGLGLLVGLAAFILLFRKWNLPGILKEKFHLYTRVKAVVYVLLQGILLAFVLSLLAAMLMLPGEVGDVLTGLAIGLNCAILAGIMQPPEQHTGSTGKNQGTNTKRTGSSGGGRRSKG